MIICLRPQPDCDADVAELTRRAVHSVALPMLQIAYVRPPVLFSGAETGLLSGHHYNQQTGQSLSRSSCGFF